MQDLPHTVTAPSLPPSLLVQWRVSGAALSLQLGPRERNKGAIFISSLIGSGGRGQEKRPVFAKHDNWQEILLWLFKVGFFLSFFLFLKRAGTASGQSKNNQALAATSAMCSHYWVDDPLLHRGSTSQTVNNAVVFQ